MSFKSVDFPSPLRPTTPRRSPGTISRLRFSKSWRPPRSIPTPRNWITRFPSFGAGGIISSTSSSGSGAACAANSKYCSTRLIDLVRRALDSVAPIPVRVSEICDVCALATPQRLAAPSWLGGSPCSFPGTGKTCHAKVRRWWWQRDQESSGRGSQTDTCPSSVPGNLRAIRSSRYQGDSLARPGAEDPDEPATRGTAQRVAFLHPTVLRRYALDQERVDC